MPNIIFNTSGIKSLLKNLKPGKAAGPDNIPMWILITCAKQIAPILQIIFTRSLRSSILPKDWLSATIIPVFKKGNKNLPSNYRPISLTVVCCKVMEHIIFHSIMNHLNTHNIINPNQLGFRPGFSCVTQPMLLTDDILKAMDSHYQVDLVLLDFSKAFDTVAHSNIASSIRLFADDCVLYRVIKSPQDHLSLQQNLNQLVQWADTWQMKLNIGKCVTMTCTRSPASTPTAYYINEHPLDITDQHDYLGVRLHSSMTWSHHIQLKVNKATKVLNFIKCTLHKCTKEVKETAYFTLVRPLHEYAAIIWDPYQQHLIDDIEKIQRRAARWVMGDYRFTSSVTEMISTLKWPLLELRRL